jgi:hypothetical protein
MRYERSPLRPGMTAIAAVLALSSTPLLAQSTDVAPTTPSSVVTAPIAAPAAPASATAAPQTMSAPSTDASSTLQPLAAPSTSLSTAAPTGTAPTASVPVVNAAPPTIATPQPAAAPAPAPVVARNEAPVVAAPVRSVRNSAATATRSVERSAATRAAAPVTEAAPALAPAAAVTPVPAPERQPLTRTAPGDELVAGDAILPVAGAAGVALLVLGGGFIALGRRRRRDEDYDAAPLGTDVPAEPVAATMVADRPVAAPVIASDPRAPTVLRNGFDISRFGRHAQAAYRGPTPDNPSLSLRKRLSRASFYDQRERMAGMQPAMAPVEPRATRPEPAPAMAARTSDHIVVRPARQQPTARPPRGLRPAFQG